MSDCEEGIAEPAAAADRAGIVAFRCRIPNPWEVGTSRLLAHLGFEALATTSMGYAFSAGQRDNTIGRDEMMAHVSAIVSATDLPVSADLENGFGDDPETVTEEAVCFRDISAMFQG